MTRQTAAVGRLCRLSVSAVSSPPSPLPICVIGWSDFWKQNWTHVMLCQIVILYCRAEIPKFHFEMLLFYLAQATANFDSFLKMGSPKKIVYVFEREGLLFYA